MKTIKYNLEIYEPGSAHDCWVAFEASAPFQNINKGDLLNPGIWEETMHPSRLAKVVNIEHIIFETSQAVTHKICVYTEEVPNTPEIKMNRPE